MASRRVFSVLNARSTSMDKHLVGSILARYCSKTFADSVNSLKHNANQILSSALQAVAPEKLLQSAIRRSSCGQHLYVNDVTYPSKSNIYIAAFGKGVYPMVKALYSIIPGHIVDGIVSVPADSTTPDLPNIRIIQGGSNNLPDSNSMRAAQSIMDMANSLGKDDILLVLITGGGSALLPLPRPGITLQDKLQAIKVIANSGADIFQLNTIRKHLSQCKGGKLAKAAYPAKVVSFIVSDVVGDNLEIIASGPTMMDSSSVDDCFAIIKALSVEEKLPISVMDFLSNQVSLSPLDGGETFSHVQNVLIGSNKVAINAASEKATDLGFDVIVHSTTLTGEAREVGRQFQQLAMERLTCNRRLCILAGGETTVKVKGDGIGGRNQELTLSTAIQMFESNIITNRSDQKCPAVLLSAGTDGQDGPTPAAGAFAYYGQLCNSTINSARQHLENNNSYTFFSTLHNGDDILITGLTNTNVMDIQILLIDTTT